MEQGFLIALIVVSAILVILIFMQSGKVKNIGSSIIGTKNTELFEDVRKRGTEKWVHWITLLLVGLFISFSIVLLIIM